ncbi:larval cuticle protein A2B-like [Prorops nasuta]|uniref:larval cuticle protein A2B-like n=1 Tax=Prorops nasuta TaxID=863751 RepID=UPI0034CDDBE5
MNIKVSTIILCFGMATLCSGSAIPAGLPVFPVAAPVLVPKIVPGQEYDPHPQYTYGYDVKDALTGDSKSQHETRNGDVVTGSYSLIEADGTRRVVEYTADPINGFNAVVHREPAAIVKPIVAKVAPIAPVPFAPFAYHS